MSGVIAYTSAYTLPQMQFVCHLVVMGSTGLNFTAAGTTPSPPQHRVQPLPEGYIANHDIGFAYKHHAGRVTWVKALNACRQEGAQLAVLDTTEKKKYLGGLKPGSWFHAGIIRLENTTPWINVNTGESVSAIDWNTNEPTESSWCAEFTSTKPGLTGFAPADTEDFFCEIPIHVESTIAAN